MSIVGTRPPTLDEWNKYELHHRARLAIKPGITGICSPLNTPKYRAIDEPDILYNQDVHKIYIKYLKMCVDSADVDVEKWGKLIQRIQWYEMSIQNEVLR